MIADRAGTHRHQIKLNQALTKISALNKREINMQHLSNIIANWN
jgi:hypothetical protein